MSKKVTLELIYKELTEFKQEMTEFKQDQIKFNNLLLSLPTIKKEIEAKDS